MYMCKKGNRMVLDKGSSKSVCIKWLDKLLFPSAKKCCWERYQLCKDDLQEGKVKYKSLKMIACHGSFFLFQQTPSYDGRSWSVFSRVSS